MDIHTDGSKFAFYTPAQVYENLSKSGAKRHMRIGGPIGSECEDIAKEVVLQKGLNYDDFLGLRGFFNKNHSQDTLDILGAPESVRLYEAGEKMPDGSIAKHATTWVEGFLYDTAKGRETYELAKAMQGSGKSLGFSIEGHVEERSGPGNRTISKARIQNVAITHVPCNPDARLEILLRSVSHANTSGESFTKALLTQRDLLRAAEQQAEAVEKTLTVGGGALVTAQTGHDVPMEDAKGSASSGDKKKPTALPLTLEELDRRILSVTTPIIQTLSVVAKTHEGRAPRARGSNRQNLQNRPTEPTQAIIKHRNTRRAAARPHLTDGDLRKASARATAQVMEMVAACSRPPVAQTAAKAPSLRKSARKSPSTATLLQSIFKAMPGVSVSFAQGLAENIWRSRARS